MSSLDPATDGPVIEQFDLFNARDMTASEVVEKFVQPAVFEQLRTPSNTLLIGPRGSGKTTLLKMLSPEAIDRRSIAGFTSPSFEGLYIPIDVQLSDRLDAMYKSQMPSEFVQASARTVYALHVFRCVARSFAWHCSSSKVKSEDRLLTPPQEARVVTSLGQLWGVSPDVPIIAALQDQLRFRQARALEAWSRQVLRMQSKLVLDPDAIDQVDLDTGIKGASEILAESATWESGKRWAFLFDEVEVVPEPIQVHLLSYLRHSDSTSLFKVAISPYMHAYRGLPDRSRGSSMNDYTIVDLQSSREDDIMEFSAQYFALAARRAGLGDVNLRSALGESPIAGSDSRQAGDAYGPRSQVARAYQALAQKDKSFEKFLTRNGVKATDLISGLPSDTRAPVRKVRQVVMVRNEYLREAAGSRRIKSQNAVPRLYAGARSVVRMCEGNPRRLAFITPILLAGFNEADGFIPTGVQVNAIARTESAFRSFLRGLPVPESVGTTMPRGLLTFMDRLGQKFNAELIARQFHEDPVSTFTVDSNVSDDYEKLIALGVNSGALVQLSDSDSRGQQRDTAVVDPITNSRGKRFRLSYLLSSHYGLTLRIGRPASLNRLMTTPPNVAFSDVESQQELPDGF